MSRSISLLIDCNGVFFSSWRLELMKLNQMKINWLIIYWWVDKLTHFLFDWLFDLLITWSQELTLESCWIAPPMRPTIGTKADTNHTTDSSSPPTRWSSVNMINIETSRTEFGHQMRSGDPPAYLSLNCFKWHTFLFLMLYCLNSAQFSENQPVCDGPIDRRTDRRTDGHTLL